MEIKSVYEALDILDDFMEVLDELYGLCSFKYGDEAYDALEFLQMYDFKKKN